MPALSQPIKTFFAIIETDLLKENGSVFYIAKTMPNQAVEENRCRSDESAGGTEKDLCDKDRASLPPFHSNCDKISQRHIADISNEISLETNETETDLPLNDRNRRDRDNGKQ